MVATCLFRDDWTSVLVRVVWMQLVDCSMHALLGQRLDDGHLLFCSTSWTLWHWVHTSCARNNQKSDFVIKLAETLCSAERNFKASRIPHAYHLKRIQDGAVENMLLHKKNKF